MADGNEREALNLMKREMEVCDFDAFVRLEGNADKEVSTDIVHYDPLDKDMDNDGIKDRYDNDFRDSDYKASVFDVDGLKKGKEDRPSMLDKLEKYKEKVSQTEHNNGETREKDKLER